MVTKEYEFLTMNHEWQCKAFSELTIEELYKIIQLRIEVFAVEQKVAYQDCDNKDQQCHHLFATADNTIIAYSRIIPPDVYFPNAASIGRIVTSLSVRNQSIGKLLLKKSLEQVYFLFGNVPVTISAQLYLQKFYEGFSFVAQSEPYIEDTILHVKMKLACPV